MKVSELCILHDKRRKTKDGLYPVRIYVYVTKNLRDYIPTPYTLSDEEYSKLNISKKLRLISQELIQLLKRTEKYLDEMQEYDGKKLRELLRGADVHHKPTEEQMLITKNIPDEVNVFDWFDNKISVELSAGRAGNWEAFCQSKLYFEKFTKSANIPFTYFTPEKLEEIERWYVDQGKSSATAGLHARNLRTVFNMARTAEVIAQSLYPFKRGGYRIPKTRKAKKSLKREELAKLFEFVPRTSQQRKVKAYFIFSYYGNGMNMKDMLMLQVKDIRDDGIIVFYREKTKNTSKDDKKPIIVGVNLEMLQVMREFGNKNSDPNSYIFPELNEAGNDPFLIRQKVSSLARNWSNTLEWIAKDCKIKGRLSFGVARHTSANAMKQEGVPLNYIQGCLDIPHQL